MVKAEVKDIQLDSNGTVVVMTDYIDSVGNIIQQGVTRYSFTITPDMASIKQKISEEVDAHCKVLVSRLYGKNKSFDNLAQLKSEMIGYTVEHAEGIIVTPENVFTVNEETIKTVEPRVKNGN